ASRPGRCRREQPRLRGDDWASFAAGSLQAGTAPPARGRLGQLRGRVVAGGNSPACAGTTLADQRKMEQYSEF
ncbi:MAG: hypothetical protein V7768_00790, partial [Dietzia cercidiphylli]